MAQAQSLKDLFELARSARERSHAPYSHCLIGAAVRTSDGRTYGGCNVENSSYGGTVCAERTAIFKAVSEGSPGQSSIGHTSVRLEEVVVVTDANPPWPPCGICRQVMMEFTAAPEKVKIHLADLTGIKRTLTLAELLPMAFTPSHLPEHRKE